MAEPHRRYRENESGTGADWFESQPGDPGGAWEGASAHHRDAEPPYPEGRGFSEDPGYGSAEDQRVPEPRYPDTERGGDPAGYREQEPQGYPQPPHEGYDNGDPDVGRRFAEPIPRYPAGASPDVATNQFPTVPGGQRPAGYGETGPTPPGAPAEQAVPPSLAPLMGESHGPGHGYPTEPVAVRRPTATPGDLGEGMYRTRRPLLAAVLVLVVLVLAVPVLLLVWRSLAEKTFNPGGVIAGTLAVVGLPMLAAGLYPLIGVPPGAFARQGFGVLLRPPYLYAVVGVLLLACAGLAAA